MGNCLSSSSFEPSHRPREKLTSPSPFDYTVPSTSGPEYQLSPHNLNQSYQSGSNARQFRPNPNPNAHPLAPPEIQHRPKSPGFEITINTVGTALDIIHIAASCAPIPGIGPAVGALRGIVTLLEHVKYNKYVLRSRNSILPCIQDYTYFSESNVIYSADVVQIFY